MSTSGFAKSLRVTLMATGIAFSLSATAQMVESQNAVKAPAETDKGSEGSEGKNLLEAVCTQCHGLRPIVMTRDGAGGWGDEVYKMITWGAQVRSPAEAKTLIDYLASTYGPSAGPMKTGVLPPGAVTDPAAQRMSNSIVLPDGKGAALVQGYCTSCHDLGPIVSTRRTSESWRRYTAVMLAKNSINPPADVAKTISTYLAMHYGVPHAK
jgi:mono/diheme cytochrome c family protein